MQGPGDPHPDLHLPLPLRLLAKLNNRPGRLVTPCHWVLYAEIVAVLAVHDHQVGMT